MPTLGKTWILYLHGLNSSSLSYKAGRLRQRLAPFPLLAPAYPAHRPHAAIARLSALLEALEGTVPPLVVGSSMGGFYGQYLARRYDFARLFLINPALMPWDLLSAYLGQTMTTAAEDSYLVTRELIDQTRAYGILDPCDGVPTTLFLDRGDEVIDYRIAEGLYRDCGRLFIYDGGDHGFQHLEEAIAVVREEVSRCQGQGPRRLQRVDRTYSALRRASRGGRTRRG